jgi:hypothetical protein
MNVVDAESRSRTIPSPAVLTSLLVLAAALIVRIVAWLRVEVIARDSIYFLHQAELLLQGRWSEALDWYQHPLSAALTAVAARFLPLELETAGSLVGVLFGALAAVGLATLVRDMFGMRAGLAAGLIYAALPLAVRLAVQPLSEGPFHCFLMLAALAGHRALLGRGLAWSMLAGASGGLAYLARPEGLGVPLVAGGCLLLSGAAGPWRRRLLAATLMGAGLLVTAGPYAAHLSREAGALRLTAKKDVAVLSGVKAETPLQPLSDEGLARRPARAAGQLLRHTSEALCHVPFLLALLGLLAPGRRRVRGELFLSLLVLLHAVVLFRLALTYGYLARRHALTPGVLLLGWAAVGLDRLGSWIESLVRFRRSSPPGNARRAAFASLLTILIAALVVIAWRPVDHRHLPLKRLGAWVRAELGAGRVVAPLGFPRVAYYAGAPPLDLLARHQSLWSPSPPPAGRFDALTEDLVKARVEIVVQSSRQPAPLRTWLEEHSTLLHRESDDRGRRWWCARRLRRDEE